MTKIKIAVIGCSSIAERTVIPSIIENSCFSLVMVGSRSKQKGEVFANKFNCKFGSYHDVLASEEVDAVYISLPAGLHYYWGKEVLNHNKHLLMEKPFVSTYQEACELIHLAKCKRLVAMEGLAYVFHPYMPELMKLLANNTIGDLRYIHSSFGFPFLPKTDIRNNPDIGGGAILDNLIYPLSFALKVFDSNYQKLSANIIWNEQTQIDERGFLKIDWHNVSAHLNYGFGFFYQNFVELWGNKGLIRIDRAFTSPKDYCVTIKVSDSNRSYSIEIPPANQFSLMLTAFFQKITGTDQSEISENDDILHRMKIISQLYFNRRNHDKDFNSGI